MARPIPARSDAPRCSGGKWPLAASAVRPAHSTSAMNNTTAGIASRGITIVLARPLDPQAERNSNIQDIYQRSIWKAPMPVHRTAKNRQAALQRVARVGHVRNAPSARRAGGPAEEGYRGIEEENVTLCLKTGRELSEQFLCVSTKFGRTPIREALQRLSREGLITILPRKGVLVSDINPRNQLLLLEVRRELERLLSRTGAERATPEQRTALQDIARG